MHCRIISLGVNYGGNGPKNIPACLFQAVLSGTMSPRCRLKSPW